MTRIRLLGADGVAEDVETPEPLVLPTSEEFLRAAVRSATELGMQYAREFHSTLPKWPTPVTLELPFFVSGGSSVHSYLQIFGLPYPERGEAALYFCIAREDPRTPAFQAETTMSVVIFFNANNPDFEKLQRDIEEYLPEHLENSPAILACRREARTYIEQMTDPQRRPA